jgi:hypothetical protein
MADDAPADHRMRHTDALSSDLEAALLRELQREWVHLNWSLFRNSMTAPAFALLDGAPRGTSDGAGGGTGALGRWERGLRCLSLSRAFVLDGPWGQVVEVLKHEMAHQYAHEVLGAIDERAHGPAFRSVCDRLGIDGSAAGVPPEGDATGNKVLRRIEKLLALAGSANVHEAELAMSQAHKLMLEHNVEAASAGARRGYRFDTVGEITQRLQLHEKRLASLLASHFFVLVLIVPAYRPRDGRRGRIVEISGTPENVEMARYVHAFLLRTADDLWAQHKKARGLSSDRDRLSFFAGVVRGFDEKLGTERTRNAERGLVWRGDADLQTWFDRRHPRTTRGTARGRAHSGAHEDGRAAGRQIVVHRPIGSDAAARGRLLGGRT